MASTHDLATAALTWRHVGPFRGGRVVAVAGHPTEQATFYMGSTGGGVWRTTDGGTYSVLQRNVAGRNEQVPLPCLSATVLSPPDIPAKRCIGKNLRWLLRARLGGGAGGRGE